LGWCAARSLYEAVLRRALVGSPKLAALHAHYLDYTRLDTKLPCPVLAYFGYHATTQDVSFGDLDTIASGDEILKGAAEVETVYAQRVRAGWRR